MIGNDIVDLECAAGESNWKRKGYLDKIYSDSEQKLIHTSKYPAQFLWALWSMKEAAYKIIHRNTQKRFYNPKKLVCNTTQINQNVLEGYVTFENQRMKTKTTLSDLYIHTIAVEGKTNFDEVVFVLNNESIVNNLSIQKDTFGIPFISNKTSVPISISHHGNYYSMAIFKKDLAELEISA